VFKRWKEHSNLAVKKKSALQHAFVLYGIDKFSFEVLEECDREMLNDREVHWIAYFGSFGEGGYNLTSGGGQGTKAMKRSEETLKRMSESQRKRAKRKPLSEAHKEKLKRPLSEETKAKLSAQKKGKKIKLNEYQCPHCNKTGLGSAMKRFHFENCKIYKELGVPKLDN
jgi:group I intron endonuclease